MNKKLTARELFINQIIECKTGNLEITGFSTINGYRYAIVRCQTCGSIDKKNVYNLIKGTGCRICSNQKVVPGINDMWTTSPDLAKLLADKNDGYKYTSCSTKKVSWCCPHCKSIIENKAIRQIASNKKLPCSKCSTGISLPNKVMNNILSQLEEIYDREFTPDWSKKRYRYDFCLYKSGQKYLIEMDGGMGHGYKDMPNFNRDEQLAIDRQKNMLAYKHGFHLIRIDCNYQNQSDAFEYILENVLHSPLAKVLDLQNIDISKLQIDSERSVILEVCNLFNSGETSMKKLASIYKVHPITISRYLTTGNKYGWCSYSSKNSYRTDYTSVMKAVICQSIETGEILYFDSVQSAAQHLRVHRTTISKCLSGKMEQVKGFSFKYSH